MTENSDHVIQIRGLSKNYPGKIFGRPFAALKSVHFQVGRGEIFGLLGPNGAGKTTLIKVLLGVIRRSQGEAKMLGFPAGDRRGRQRVGYLPEQLKLPWHQTANTALEYYGRLSGLSAGEVRRKRSEILSLVGLTGRERESVKRFSKGMQQRLGLAQAILHNPELLILDEPTDGLDPVGRSQIRTILKTLRDQGRTVFLNSHLLQEVEMVCDRVAILSRGELKFVGRIDELTPEQNMAILVETYGDGERLHSLADQFPGWKVAPLEDGRFSLTVPVVDQPDVDRLLDALRGIEHSILSVNRRKKTLEDAFLNLIATEAEVL